jgi:hypothetical protein
MSTLAERYSQFQQANLAAQQQALATGQQQQITSSRDASGNVSFGYSPTGAPYTPTQSPIGNIGGGGGGSSGGTGSKTIIDFGNELQAKQEQEQAARQAAAAQNRQQGPQPGTVEYYRQQIQQSQVAVEQRRLAAGIPVRQDQGLADYQRWAYETIKAGRNPQAEGGKFGSLTIAEARERFADYATRNPRQYYVDERGQRVNPFDVIAQQQAANDAARRQGIAAYAADKRRVEAEARDLGYEVQWSRSPDGRLLNQAEYVPIPGQHQYEYVRPDPTNPFKVEKRDLGDLTAQQDKLYVQDAPAPAGGFFGPVIDAAKGARAEAENLVKNLAYSAQGVGAIFLPRQVPRRTLDAEGNEIASNMPKPPALKTGVGTDLSGLGMTAAFQLATTGKTDVQAGDLQKIGENIAKNPAYAAGNVLFEVASFFSPGLATKGARLAQVSSTVSRAEEIAAVAAKRVGYQESAIQALDKAATPLARGPLGTFWRPLWESGRVIYPKMEITGEAATLAAGKAQLKVPTMPEAFAIMAGADVTAPPIGRILPSAGEVRIATAPLSEEQKIALRGFEQPKVGQGPPAPRTLQPGELAAKDIKDYHGKGFTGAVAGKILGTDARVATEAADISLQKAAVSITGKTPKLGEFGLDLAEQLPQRTVRASPLIPVSSDVPLWSRVTFDLKEVKAAASALAKRASQIEGAEEALKDLTSRGTKDIRPFDFTPAAETTKIGKTSMTPLERADAFSFDAGLKEVSSVSEKKWLDSAVGAAAVAGISAFFGSGQAAGETTTVDARPEGRGPPPSVEQIFNNRAQDAFAKLVNDKPGQAVEQARKASENMINALAKMQNSKGTEKQIATQQLLGNLKLEGESDLDRAVRKNIREMMIERQDMDWLKTPTEVSQQFLKQVTNTRVSLDSGTLLHQAQTSLQTPAALLRYQQQLVPRFDVPRIPPERIIRPPDFSFWPGLESSGKLERRARKDSTEYFETTFAVPDPLVAVFGKKQAKRLPGYKVDDYSDYLSFLPGSKKSSRSKGRRR